MKVGDLVLYDARTSRDTGVSPKLGIIVRESNEPWFCEVLLSNGQVIKDCHYVNLKSASG